MRAFANAALDVTPTVWNYSSADAAFRIHDYEVRSNLTGPGLIYLDHVTQGGLGVRTRKWAPDGPAANCSSLAIETSPLYRAGALYRIIDLETTATTAKQYDAAADRNGRLHLQTDCGGHEIGVNGPGSGTQPVVILPLTFKDHLRLPPGEVVSLPVRVFNPRTTAQTGVRLQLKSAYPTVEVLRVPPGAVSLDAGEVAELGKAFQVRFTTGDGGFERARLTFTVSSESSKEEEHYADVFVEPENIPAPISMAILDGRAQTFPVFRQRGNTGGGSSIQRTVTEGRGNGNGILEPGERATIWVKVKQGIDPFDKNNWRRAKLYTSSPWLTEVEDLQEQKQLEWTGAKNRTSVVELSPTTPASTPIRLILDCEGWSYRFTPDVRYGFEPLYQAFEIHHHQLFAWTWSNP